MTIELYRVRNDQDQEWAGPFTDISEAMEYARDEHHRNHDHYAVVAEIYEYSDSELVYTTDNADVWPPEKGQ